MSAAGNGPPKHNPKVPPKKDGGTPGTGSGTPVRDRPPPADGAGRGAGVPPPPGGTSKEGTPREDKPSLADYERLKEVVQRLTIEKEDALQEIDALVVSNRDFREREADLLEQQADLSILEMGDSKSTKVPPFTGTDKDEHSADIWLTNVTRLAEINSWKDEQTLSGCLLALKDVASVWRESETRLGSTSLSTWPRFQAAFLARFQEAKSAVEQVSIISNLKQQQKESVRDYFDRVNNSVHLSAHDSLLAMKVDATVTTADQGFQACITHFMRVHYVSGLKPEVRRLVEAKFSSLKTKEDLVKAAVEAEVASGQEARHIASLQEELAALRMSAGGQYSSRGRGSSRGSRGGSSRGGSSRGGASGSSGGLSHRQKVSNRTTWIFCFKCKQWGKHRANECKYSEAQVRDLKPQDENKVPSGAPFDPHFNLQQTGGSLSGVSTDAKN